MTISVWGDGIAEGAAYAAAGDGKCIEAWGSLKDNTESSCEVIANMLEENGFSNASVMYNVLNEQNKENILLSLYNGEIVYDVVSEG